jgi:hypothetical protein
LARLLRGRPLAPGTAAQGDGAGRQAKKLLSRLAAALLLAGLGLRPAVAQPERGGEEFVVLIVVHLTAAEFNCPFRIEEGRLRRLLERHGMSLGTVYTRSRSQELKSRIDKIASAFAADRQKACDEAWKTFGPAAPFEGFLQPR